MFNYYKPHYYYVPLRKFYDFFLSRFLGINATICSSARVVGEVTHDEADPPTAATLFLLLNEDGLDLFGMALFHHKTVFFCFSFINNFIGRVRAVLVHLVKQFHIESFLKYAFTKRHVV